MVIFYSIMHYFFLLIILFLSGCFQSYEYDKNEESSNRLALLNEDRLLNGFLPQWKEFTSALAEKDTLRLNTFIQPANGMYVLSSEGALPGMTNTMSFLGNNLLYGKILSEKTGNAVRCELKNEELPVINCDSMSFYNKEGCFMQFQNRLDKSKILEFVKIPREEYEKAMTMMHTITVTVVNTGNFVYYFSHINNKWFLAFLDIRRPCEA